MTGITERDVLGGGDGADCLGWTRPLAAGGDVKLIDLRKPETYLPAVRKRRGGWEPAKRPVNRKLVVLLETTCLLHP